MRYDPGRDLGWLLLRPWVAFPRLVQVLLSLAGLVLVLLLRGGSSDPAVQQGLARRILNTLTGLGPCFIKLGQALSTRPDLVRRDWLEELTRLQDDLPAFPHATALACIREELGAPPVPVVHQRRELDVQVRGEPVRRLERLQQVLGRGRAQ